jgi:tetratricopeptide (TPR) repeat protein
MQAHIFRISLGVVFCFLACTSCQTPRSTGSPEAQAAPLTPEEKDRADSLARFGQGLLDELNDDGGEALTNFMEAARLQPDSEELRFRVAMGLLRERRFDEARSLMEEYCERHPKSERAWLWMALVYRAADMDEEAIGVYRRVTRMAPASPVAYIEMANLLIESRREPEAVEILFGGIKRIPEPQDVVKYLCDLLIRRAATGKATPAELRRLPAMEKHLDAAIARDPDDLSLLQRLGDLCIVRGDPGRAVECFERIEQKDPGDLRTRQRRAMSFIAVGDKAKAIAALEELAALHPDNARIPYYIGVIHEQTGEPDKAADAFARAARCEPADPTSYLKLAILNVDEKPDDAMEVLKRGVEKNPDDARFEEMLAYVLMSQKKHAEALPHFATAERLMETAKAQPMTPNFALHHAISLQMSGKIFEAARVLKRAMETNASYLEAYVQYLFHEQDETNALQGVSVLDELTRQEPEDVQLLVYRGLLNGYAKRYTAALAAFDKAVQLAGQTSEGQDLLTSQFYYWYGSACERDGQIEKAEQMFRKCIELDPDNAEAYNYLAYMWAERGIKLDEALELSLKSLKIEPDSAAYIDTLGWICFMKGDYQRALKEIQRAANLLPEDPTIVEHVGDVMDKLGRPDKALSYWKRAYVFDPKNEKLAAKLTALGVDLAPLKDEAGQRAREKQEQKIKRAANEADPADAPSAAPR